MGTSLDRYRLLGRSGLKVSPLCLGTMTFGKEWGFGADKPESRKILDRYAGKGGNFLDTANMYTNGTSESFLGEFLKGRRDRFVLATKFTLNMEPGNPNAGGNSRRNMFRSVEASLRRLQTDYIDLYWLHAWEFRTPVEEVMRGLDDLVRQGKILYIGVSDAPAWKIAEANTLAALRGWTPFVALQIHYNLAERTPERDLIPMAREFGIAVLPWSPLAGGVLAGKYTAKDLKETPGKEDPGSRKSGNILFGQLTERSLAIADAVKKMAAKIGKSASQVALNWLLQKPGVVSPIIGARNVAQLEDNLGCLDFSLTEEQVRRLDDASRIELGFPHDFLALERIQSMFTGGTQIEAGK